MGMPGLAVPMGNFIPAMVIGSLIGRFMGEGLDSFDSLHGEVTNAGVCFPDLARDSHDGR